MDLALDDPRFTALTGMTTKSLRAEWAKGSLKKFDRTKINGWVDIARYLMLDGSSMISDIDEDMQKPDARLAGPGSMILTSTGRIKASRSGSVL